MYRNFSLILFSGTHYTIEDYAERSLPNVIQSYCSTPDDVDRPILNALRTWVSFILKMVHFGGNRTQSFNVFGLNKPSPIPSGLMSFGKNCNPNATSSSIRSFSASVSSGSNVAADTIHCLACSSFAPSSVPLISSTRFIVCTTSSATID